MDIVLLVLAGILVVVGVIGCIVPVLPGPPISYIGLLLLQKIDHPFTKEYMWILLAIVVVVTIIDNVFPIYATKLTGGSKAGTWGSTIGLIVGFFIGPLGVIIGPFLGALIGELIKGQRSDVAFKSAFGAFLGFIMGTGLKLMSAGWIAFEFFKAVF